MKKIILIALLLQLLLCCNTPDIIQNKVLPTPPQSNTSSTSSALTTFFYDYDRKNSFRGIHFGSTYQNVKDKLKLTKLKTVFGDISEIHESEYLSFGPLIFESGQAYFTNDSLWQIVLTLKHTDANKYILYKNHLTEKLGITEEENNITMWKGKNIIIMFFPKTNSDSTKQITLSIFNERLNRIASDNILSKNKDIPNEY